MENLIAPALTAIITFLLTNYLGKWNSAKIRPKINGQYELRHHKLILYIAQVLTAIALFVLILFWNDKEPDAKIIGGTYACIIAISALWFFLMYNNQIVTFNNRFIENSNIIGRKKKFNWNDIETITHHTYSNYFTIVKGKSKMKFNDQMVGINQLINTIEKETSIKINKI